MPAKRSSALCALIVFLSTLLTIEAALACLGVSRTINISKFNAALGTGAGGNIGLRNREVVLTFDDGPMPGATTRVLSALSRECTKATFFIVGQMARANPSTLQRVARAGHTIGHHTYTHANLRHGSLALAQKEIRGGIQATRAALGPYKRRSSKLFRYPYLANSASLDRIVRQNGMIPFSASITSHDWKGGSSATIVNRIMSQLAQRGRGVILMHDIHGRTASALPLLLRRLKKGGYRIVHIRSGGSGSPRGVALASLSKKARRPSTKRARVDRTTTSTNRETAPRRKFRLFSFRRTDSAYSPDRHSSKLRRKKAASLKRINAKRKPSRKAKTKKKDKQRRVFGFRLNPEFKAKLKKRRAERQKKRKKKRNKKS